jgi:ligand-binding sensor domain-containing protein
MRKVTVGVSAALLLGLGIVTAAALFFVHMNSGLQAIRRHVSTEGDLAFRLLTLRNPGSPDNGNVSAAGFELVSPPSRYTTGIDVAGKLYLAGPGGLAIFPTLSSQPVLLRTGPDLPPAPIVALAAGRLRGDATPSLVAATQGEGLLLLSMDANAPAHTQQLRPLNAEDRDITAVLPLDSGDLLLGTRRAGLLLYNGKTLRLFQPGFAKLAITALAGNEGDLWIGTRTEGVLHWRAGQLETIGTSAGLPDPLVEAIAIGTQGVFVGTPLGVAQFTDGHLSRVLGRGLFVRALALDADALMAATMDQGLHAIPLAPHTPVHAPIESHALQITHFFAAGNDLMAIGDDGVLQDDGDGAWQKVLASPQHALADANVTSLAFAPDGRLWIGYFDRGVDVLDLRTNHADHVEDDHVFCINRIVPDTQRRTIDVATSNGLVLFDATRSVPREQQLLSRRDGIIADQITDVAFTRSGLALATPAGITFLTASGAQSLYAFQGLVNNHVYALAAQPGSDHVIAGTLGGLSILDDENVRQNVTLKNSGLQRNWITAVLRVPQSGPASAPTWFVGTYGGGVVQMDDAGRVTAAGNPAPEAVINPNAMLATPLHILAGTLADGLLSYNRATRRWSHLTASLPSQNVTAFAANTGELYIGTENGIVRIAEARLP